MLGFDIMHFETTQSNSYHEIFSDIFHEIYTLIDFIKKKLKEHNKLIILID